MEFKHLHSSQHSGTSKSTYIDLTDSPPASSRASQPLKHSHMANQPSYSSYIKPATAFAPSASQTFRKPFPHVEGWPAWVQSQSAKRDAPPNAEIEAENFNLDSVNITPSDLIKHSGNADAHMRELLAAAVGEINEPIEEGDDRVDGFSDAVRLMPHQIQGVKWMRGRESARRYGGILADDMGLGKTVQTLARIVEGQPTPAETKAGFKGTLIVAPLAVMEQWVTEVRTKTKPGTLKVATYHGPTRPKSLRRLQAYDVIITTYQTLASEHRDERAVEAASSDEGLQNGILYHAKWLRVVLDEAQNIKNKNTKAAKATTALQAKYRWCLTGTPIQNNVEELYSLFRFLRARPLDKWEIFRDRISREVKSGRTKVAMKRLHLVLKAIMLRRTKDATLEGKPILLLPHRSVELVKCEFDADERAFYDSLEQKTALSFNKFLRQGTVMANYTSVLTMLLRLRQACDHPSLVASTFGTVEEVDAKDDAHDADDLADMLQELGVGESIVCTVCMARISSGTHCHKCDEGIEPEAADTSSTPLSSAKIRALLTLLRKLSPDDKVIIFSQFTSYLNIVQDFLQRDGFGFVRYDGQMRNDKRLESLDKIKNDVDTRIILISFKAGSTGLNLACCNHVVLLDMWWNPALEDQAFDRAHRLGQTKDVNIYKFTVPETVEDRILILQNNKRELARAALSGDAVKNVMKLTLNDIMALFQRGDHNDSSDEED